MTSRLTTFVVEIDCLMPPSMFPGKCQVELRHGPPGEFAEWAGDQRERLELFAKLHPSIQCLYLGRFWERVFTDSAERAIEVVSHYRTTEIAPWVVHFRARKEQG